MSYSIQELRKDLVETSKLVSAADFDQLANESENLASLLALLIKNGHAKQTLLNDYLIRTYGVKYVNLKHELIPPEVLNEIPKEFSVEHEVIAFGYNGPKLQLAMVNPQDLQAVEYVRRRTNREVEIYLTDLPGFQEIIKGYKTNIQELFSDVLNSSSQQSGFAAGQSKQLQDLAEGVPITKAVNSIIEYAVSEGASDIHIEPTEEELYIRFRVDGILNDVLILLNSIHSVLTARIKIMAALKIDEHRRPQDGRIKLEVNELPISLRVSILPTYHGEKIVMRILDESSTQLTLKDLGFAGAELEAVQQAVTSPDGLILTTGPTGSGKTTTLYTVLRQLNKPEVNINTVEDPIEYSMPRINQTQVNQRIDFTFANGLRSLLRQDPDIIMVGEIRDGETADMAINASLTGHLVLSTLHTNDSPTAVPRLLDMGIEPFLLASTLKIVIAQRLLRKLDPDTRKEIKMDSTTEEYIAEQLKGLSMPDSEIKKWTKIKLFAPVNSKDGYKGRLGIYEVLKIDDAVRELITKRESVVEIRKQMLTQGFKPMFINGLSLVDQGITSLEEVMRVAQE